MKKKFLWCMMALTALLFASCSSELALEGFSPDNVVTGDEVEVTFSVAAEKSSMLTRAGGPGQYQNQVGKGQEIDMLIYAVYEKEGDDYNLLEQYGKGLVGIDAADGNGTSTQPFVKEQAVALSVGKDKNDTEEVGQTVINVGNKFKNGESVTITLRLMRNKTYHIAFWAQSSQTTAFNTDELTNVTVLYENAKNNDELRDAFCKVERFSVTPSTAPRDVILTRPMAQINVGTTGADYKHMLLSKQVFTPKAITQSKISLSGVAQFLNVVTDEVITSDDAGNSLLTDVTFKYGIIPAFMYMNTPFPDSKENADFYYKGKSIYEEFLKIDLDGDKKIVSYKTNYPTYGPKGEFLTETFKYLSMCYALVPASVNPVPNEMEKYTSSILKEVRVSFAENDEQANDENYDYETIRLSNVPVHRNWRTNIIGGLKWMRDPDPDDPDDPDDPGYTVPEDPDDPDDPDDPTYPDDPGETPPDPDPDDTSVFKFLNARIFLDQDYYGEYNTPDEGNTWEEFPEQEEAEETPTE